MKLSVDGVRLGSHFLEEGFFSGAQVGVLLKHTVNPR